MSISPLIFICYFTTYVGTFYITHYGGKSYERCYFMNRNVEAFNSLEKIRSICKEQGWSIYKLSKESGIPYSSLNNMFNRNTDPSLSTLTKLCHGLNITLSDFFSNAKSDVILINEDTRELLNLYTRLPRVKQQRVRAYID